MTRPPFATTDRPFCECGWAMPAEIEVVAFDVPALKVRCPMCGKWHGDAEVQTPDAKRSRLRVIKGGSLKEPE